MITPPDYVTRYSSAKQRFLKSGLEAFFERECPKLFGPILRSKIVEELVNILTQALPLKDHLMPGQMIWYAVDRNTRAGSDNLRLVPVVLTLVNQEDIEQLSAGVSPSQVRKHAIARITKEAYEQGGLLSMREIGLFTWHDGSALSRMRKAYERQHNVTLPHTGSLHDRGPCISHKVTIIKKILVEKKDPYTVARETNHSIGATDRYLKDLRRVQYCWEDGKDIDFISRGTGIHKYVVKQYVEILQDLQKST